jgi:hypothetical protein
VYILGLVKVNRGPVKPILLGMCLSASKTDDWAFTGRLWFISLILWLDGTLYGTGGQHLGRLARHNMLRSSRRILASPASLPRLLSAYPRGSSSMLDDFRRPNIKICILPGLVDLVGLSWKSRNTEYDIIWCNIWWFAYDWDIMDRETYWHARGWRRWVSLHATISATHFHSPAIVVHGEVRGVVGVSTTLSAISISGRRKHRKR